MLTTVYTKLRFPLPYFFSFPSQSCDSKDCNAATPNPTTRLYLTQTYTMCFKLLQELEIKKKELVLFRASAFSTYTLEEYCVVIPYDWSTCRQFSSLFISLLRPKFWYIIPYLLLTPNTAELKHFITEKTGGLPCNFHAWKWCTGSEKCKHRQSNVLQPCWRTPFIIWTVSFGLFWVRTWPPPVD